MSDNNTIDTQQIRSRYIYPGNLKVSLDTYNQLSLRNQDLLQNVLGKMISRITPLCAHNQNKCIVYPLSINRKLYIDWYSNKLNLYIKDDANNIFTQYLTLADIDKICRAESIILAVVHTGFAVDKVNNPKDMLESALVRSAYDSKIHNRGSPTVFAHTIDDDFSLDI